jgi:hypothetical protein
VAVAESATRNQIVSLIPNLRISKINEEANLLKTEFNLLGNKTKVAVVIEIAIEEAVIKMTEGLIKEVDLVVTAVIAMEETTTLAVKVRVRTAEINKRAERGPEQKVMRRSLRDLL